MKSATIFLFFSAALLISCVGDDIQPVEGNYRLSKILNYSSSSAAMPYGYVTFDYDGKGNVVKESMFDYPNTLTVYTLYEFSKNNTLKCKKMFGGQVGNLTLGGYVNYDYTNGNLTKEELFSGDATLQYITYSEFDGANRIATYKKNDNLGVHHLYKYSYDKKNRLVSEAAFMYDQILDHFSKYAYDDKDRLLITQRFNQDSVLTSQIEKVYHGSGSLPDEELSIGPSGELISKKLLAYDSWGNPIGCTTEGNSTCPIFTRKYNGQLLLEEIMYHPTLACAEWWVTRYEYEVK